jgi:hypothetical protein
MEVVLVGSGAAVVTTTLDKLLPHPFTFGGGDLPLIKG